MRNSLVVGIDVGTHATRVVVVDHANGSPEVVAHGIAETKGMRHGYVVNQQEVTRSIQRAAQKASQQTKTRIRRAYIALGGISTRSEIVTSSVVISKGDGEITHLDIEKLTEKTESILLGEKKNRKIIHSIPLGYTLDGNEVLGRPVGMHGVKLEVTMLFITTLEHHFDDLIHAVNEAGIDIIDVVAAPVATGMATLSQRQKVVGSLLVDIGADTVSIAVFENDTIVSLKVFSIGSNDITNDIALGFQIGLEEAELLKTGQTEATVPKRRLEEIIEARTADILELIHTHLKKIKRAGLLPAGVIIVGGGAELVSIEELTKKTLHLPVQVVDNERVQHLTRRKLPNPTWLTAYGLCFLDDQGDAAYRSSPLTKMLRSWKNNIRTVLEQFLP